MNARARVRTAGVLICAIVASAAGQVRRIETGGALDANYQVGSRGSNTRLGSVRGINSQLYVNGQVTGLRAFRGTVGYSPADELRLDLPSTSLDSFRRRSVGVRQAIAGRTYAAAPYYERTRTVFGVPQMRLRMTSPGSNIPLTGTITAARATALYKAATERYTSIADLPPGQVALATPMVVPSVGEFVNPGAMPGYGQRANVPRRPSASSYFSVLREEDRLRLAEELREMARQENMQKNTVEQGVQNEIDARAYSEKELLAPRSDEFVPPQAEQGREGLLKPNQDVFVDLLLRLEEQRQGETAGEYGLAKTPASPAKQGEQLVRLTSDKAVVISSLAGLSPDIFNKYMTEAERLLKEGRYYDSARTYELAAIVKPGNPLARAGLALALFAAGEPYSAALQLKRAIRLFPPLMETRFEIVTTMNKDDLEAGLKLTRRPMEGDGAAMEPDLAFLAAFIYFNTAQLSSARLCAEELKKAAGSDEVYATYADFILTGKRPGRTPSRQDAKPSQEN